MTALPILLFAAGKGTRMGHLTAQKPKSLVEVSGQPLINHALQLVDEIPAAPRVVNIHHYSEQLREHLVGQNVTFSDESDQLRETGGGLKHAMPLLNGSPVMTLNTDAVWVGPNPLRQLLDAWDDRMEALLLTIPLARVNGHAGSGDYLRDAQGRLSRGQGEVYSGAQIIRTDRLDEIEQDTFSMNVVWDQIQERDGLYGTSYSGNWCDVGQPSSIPIAEAMLKAEHDV